MDASEFARTMGELNIAQTHYQTTGEWDKSATISEKMATNMLSIRREEEAAFWFDSAASKWRHYGDNLNEQGQKEEALEAYNRALANFEKAMTLDPRYRSSPMSTTLRDLTEKAIKDLQSH